MQMKKHARFLYQPVSPMGKDGRMVTGCDAHWRLCKEAAAEGTVLLKNKGVLPLAEGARVSLFGVGAGDFIFGGGGSSRRTRNGPRRGEDIGIRLDVTFEEAAFGADKEISYHRVENCTVCNGSGSADGQVETCSQCRGAGQVRITRI